uniref:4Fe-4S ferredoxin-type domain-containing protein n=1 Tax=Ascaris lumbricoides TaxID=6252 RepID=A0A0M3IBI8_ASCLU
MTEDGGISESSSLSSTEECEGSCPSCSCIIPVPERVAE